MEDRLRRSAVLWRSVAGAALVLGVIGSVFIAVVAARGPYEDEFDALVFVMILLPSLLVLTLSLGFFFMGTQMMEGMAELIGLSQGGASEAHAGSTARPSRPITRHVKEPGAALRSSLGAGQDVAQLPSGSLVTEVERWGHAVKVTTLDGVTGWLRDHEVF